MSGADLIVLFLALCQYLQSSGIAAVIKNKHLLRLPVYIFSTIENFETTLKRITRVKNQLIFSSCGMPEVWQQSDQAAMLGTSDAMVGQLSSPPGLGQSLELSSCFWEVCSQCLIRLINNQIFTFERELEN